MWVKFCAENYEINKPLHKYHDVTEYEYIATQVAFDELCEHYAQQTVLAIDTEFVRTQTLTPLLGLVQIFDGTRLALIDPVAVTDLQGLADLLTNQGIVKVAHSCSEDLEALWHALGVIPAPIFDTQFAAGLLDKGVSIGYANLVEQLFEISLDKGESRTDWMQRPLSTAQLSYAAADVTHLMAIYEALLPLTEAKNITSWVYQEIAQLGIKKSTPVASEYAYLHLKNIWKLNSRSLAAFRMLAKWRLEEARRENKSVNFVLKEDAMYELALKLPLNTQKLFEIKALYSKPARMYKDVILSICNQAKALDTEQCPPKVQRLIEFTGYKGALAALKKEIEEAAQQHDIPVSLLASKKQMNQLLQWCWFDIDELAIQGMRPDMLCSWRRTVLIERVQTLLPILSSRHEIKRSL